MRRKRWVRLIEIQNIKEILYIYDKNVILYDLRVFESF